MQALLDFHYRRLQHAISVHMILFMMQYPGQAFFVSFDYTKSGEVEIRFVSKDELPTVHELEVELPTQWVKMPQILARYEFSSEA